MRTRRPPQPDTIWNLPEASFFVTESTRFTPLDCIGLHESLLQNEPVMRKQRSAKPVAAERPPPSATEPYNQHTSPFGKRRFLDYAREGRFPAYKVGKLVIAKRADVDSYIARHLVTTRVAEQRDDADDILARVGLRAKK